jgi:RNA polymerase sigma-70 factor (ECF subfamily)
MTEFETLMIEHHPAVLRTACRLLGQIEDAKDVAQEVFLKLLRNTSENPRQIEPWLYRVTVNVCHDYYRRRRRITAVSTDWADPAPGPESIMRTRQTQHMLAAALGRLTRREREAVVLRHIEGFSAVETAGILNLEAATVRSRTRAARTKLANYLRHRPEIGHNRIGL